MVAKTRSQDSALFLGQPGLAVLSSWVRLLSLASRSFPESNPRVELDQVGSSLTPRGPHQRLRGLWRQPRYPPPFTSIPQTLHNPSPSLWMLWGWAGRKLHCQTRKSRGLCSRTPAEAMIEVQNEPARCHRMALHSHTDLQAEAPSVFALSYPLPSPWL